MRGIPTKTGRRSATRITTGTARLGKHPADGGWRANSGRACCRDRMDSEVCMELEPAEEIEHIELFLEPKDELFEGLEGGV